MSKNVKLDPFLLFPTKQFEECLKDLNFKPYTLKQLNGNIGNTFQGIGRGKSFLKRTSSERTQSPRLTNETT